jgi:hypothetical protein
MKAARHQARAAILECLEAHTAECVNWPFAVNRKGYGIVRWNGQSAIASRVVCELAYGPVPTGMEVAHSCGNARCCNPAHLRHATSAENKADKIIHGTALYGDRHPRAKLTEAQVRAIKSSKAKKSDLARTFGVSPAAINLIVKGVNWAHV